MLNIAALSTDENPTAIQELMNNHICNKCSLLPQKLYIFDDCSHRICIDCLDENLCPYDKSLIKLPTESLPFKLKFFEIRCPYSAMLGGNCQWEGAIINLKNHQMFCEFACCLQCKNRQDCQSCGEEYVLCDIPIQSRFDGQSCQMKYKRKNQQSHVSSDCLAREVYCQKCNTSYPIREMAEHAGLCWRGQCENQRYGCTLSTMSPYEREQHTTYGCPYDRVPCGKCFTFYVRKTEQVHLNTHCEKLRALPMFYLDKGKIYNLVQNAMTVEEFNASYDEIIQKNIRGFDDMIFKSNAIRLTIYDLPSQVREQLAKRFNIPPNNFLTPSNFIKVFPIKQEVQQEIGEKWFFESFLRSFSDSVFSEGQNYCVAIKSYRTFYATQEAFKEFASYLKFYATDHNTFDPIKLFIRIKGPTHKADMDQLIQFLKLESENFQLQGTKILKRGRHKKRSQLSKCIVLTFKSVEACHKFQQDSAIIQIISQLNGKIKPYLDSIKPDL